MRNSKAREQGHLSQVVSTVYGGISVDNDRNFVYKQLQVYTILSDNGFSLLPPPTTDHGGSELSFPCQTPKESTQYEESLLGLHWSALQLDPASTPRASAGIILCRYIQSEENASQHANEEEGMRETRKVYTPIPRQFEISDSSYHSITEVEWRDESPYMTPTKKGKKHNKGKRVKRPEMLKQPIPNMPQTPSRIMLEDDSAKPAQTFASEDELASLGKFICEYLQNTNGLRNFLVGPERNDASYDVWCQQQSQHVAARQNHTDAAVMSMRNISTGIKDQFGLDREYEEAREEKLDYRLSKIEKELAKIAPVNMAKTIENAMRDCMETKVVQVTDQEVAKLEKLTEKEKREEIRRGKQVEATPEDEDMSDIEIQPGVTPTQEENGMVARILEYMEVEEHELEVSKRAPVIPPGERRQEFPICTPSRHVKILKTPAIAPAVPEQNKKDAKRPEVKHVPNGPRAGGKNPQVEEPRGQNPEKTPEETKKGS